VNALARLLAQDGHAARAHEHLRTVCAAAEAGFDSREIDEAQRLRASLA
jgi:hypothetical protein